MEQRTHCYACGAPVKYDSFNLMKYVFLDEYRQLKNAYYDYRIACNLALDFIEKMNRSNNSVAQDVVIDHLKEALKK